MKQTKYNRWIQQSFVPTVKMLMGTSLPFTNGALRKAFRNNSHLQFVTECNKAYRAMIGGKITGSSTPWEVYSFSDRMGRALREAVAEGLIIGHCNGTRIKVDARGSWPHYRTIGATYRALSIVTKTAVPAASSLDALKLRDLITVDNEGQQTIAGDLATLEVTVVREHEDNIVTIRLPDKRLIDIDASWLTLSVD